VEGETTTKLCCVVEFLLLFGLLYGENASVTVFPTTSLKGAVTAWSSGIVSIGEHIGSEVKSGLATGR
jgi:hypothetical protein